LTPHTIKPHAPEFDGYTVERIGWLSQRKLGATKSDSRFYLQNKDFP
jgi:hypothetical protein